VFRNANAVGSFRFCHMGFYKPQTRPSFGKTLVKFGSYAAG